VASNSARKPKLTLHQKREAIRRRDHGDETVREIARSYNVSHSTISRLAASPDQLDSLIRDDPQVLFIEINPNDTLSEPLSLS
jgi:hypothetical protein